MMDFTIRVLDAQELDDKTVQQVDGLLHLLNPEAGAIGAGRLTRLIKEGRLMLFVAEDHSDELYEDSKDNGISKVSQIIGMLTLCICPTLEMDKLWIEDVVVNEDYRGKGIGRRLVQEAVSHAKRLSSGSKLYLTSNPSRKTARAIYASEGFEEYNTGVFRMKL